MLCWVCCKLVEAIAVLGVCRYLVAANAVMGVLSGGGGLCCVGCVVSCYGPML